MFGCLNAKFKPVGLMCGLFFFLNIILRLLTKHILQLQNLKLKGSMYRYYRLDQNYIKTRKNNTAVVIVRTITLDLLINRLFR